MHDRALMAANVARRVLLIIVFMRADRRLFAAGTFLPMLFRIGRHILAEIVRRLLAVRLTAIRAHRLILARRRAAVVRRKAFLHVMAAGRSVPVVVCIIRIGRGKRMIRRSLAFASLPRRQICNFLRTRLIGIVFSTTAGIIVLPAGRAAIRRLAGHRLARAGMRRRHIHLIRKEILLTGIIGNQHRKIKRHRFARRELQLVSVIGNIRSRIRLHFVRQLFLIAPDVLILRKMIHRAQHGIGIFHLIAAGAVRRKNVLKTLRKQQLERAGNIRIVHVAGRRGGIVRFIEFIAHIRAALCAVDAVAVITVGKADILVTGILRRDRPRLRARAHQTNQRQYQSSQTNHFLHLCQPLLCNHHVIQVT